jgi:hypothetical protein
VCELRAVRLALADHVEVPLQDDRRRRLAALGRGHVEHEVARLVLPHPVAVLLAQAFTYLITGSSCRDGRAIVVSRSKCSQNAAGSTPDRTDALATISPSQVTKTARQYSTPAAAAVLIPRG